MHYLKTHISHKLCSPITCSCQIITNTRTILKLLWCDITSSSKDSSPFQRNLLPSRTTNRQHHIQKQSVPGLPAYLKYCYSVIIHGTKTFIQGQCPTQLWYFNSSFPFHSQTPIVYNSAQLRTLKQLFHTNIKRRGTRRRERKWQEGGENYRSSSFTGFTLHTIRWGGEEMLENINKGDHVKDSQVWEDNTLLFLLPYMKQFNMKCS